jgi:hypothetical protein
MVAWRVSPLQAPVDETTRDGGSAQNVKPDHLLPAASISERARLLEELPSISTTQTIFTAHSNDIV